MRWQLFAAALAVVVAGGNPVAAEQTIPTQEGWDAARQTVTTADGLTMGYVQLGSGEGTPLILLHGFTDNSRSWSLPAPWLGDRTIYAVDLRGHGLTDAPACCYGVDTLAHDLGGFMDAMDIDRADLVGHSMGSMTAAVFAALNTDRVNRLVLVSTAVKVPQGASDWLWANVPGLPDPIDPDSQFMLDWYWNPNPVDDVFLTMERTESAATARQTWLGGVVSLSLADWSSLAPRITAPTLVIWGDQDPLFGAEAQAAVKAALPAARYETFAGFGHNMFWETPQATGELIAGFLSE
jgi:pimeloyl-ACP methyl ester carboxylesterase